jgi:ParB-like chromosome segregation protein Spo0J
MADEVVVLNGIKETLDALKDFDKDAVKRFNKVINTELAGAERDARNLVTEDPPMSGWSKLDAAKGRTRGGAGWPGWNAGEIRSKITKTKAQGRTRGDYTTSAGALLNKSAAGSIFEVAGRKTKAGFEGGSSAQFLRTLGNRFGKASRLVWRVVDKDKQKIERNVARALEEAKAELQKHLNRERV